MGRRVCSQLTLDWVQKNGVVLPEVGSWYRRLNGNLFEVVAVDEEDATVELQHFDGTIEEVELESWPEMSVEPAEAPEDWSGSVDVGLEDLQQMDSAPVLDWQDPLDFLDRYE